MADRMTSQSDVTSVIETRAVLGTYRELGPDHETAVIESFVARLGDRIDDRVAQAFDEQLDERDFAVRGRTGQSSSLAVLVVSLLLGTFATLVVSGVAGLALVWACIVLIDLAYFFRRA